MMDQKTVEVTSSSLRRKTTRQWLSFLAVFRKTRPSSCTDRRAGRNSTLHSSHVFWSQAATRDKVTKQYSLLYENSFEILILLALRSDQVHKVSNGSRDFVTAEKAQTTAFRLANRTARPKEMIEK